MNNQHHVHRLHAVRTQCVVSKMEQARVNVYLSTLVIHMKAVALNVSSTRIVLQIALVFETNVTIPVLEPAVRMQSVTL